MCCLHPPQPPRFYHCFHLSVQKHAVSPVSYFQCLFSPPVSFSIISHSRVLLPKQYQPQDLQYMSLCGMQFPIIEFDPETFRLLLDYLHTGCCSLTCCNIPGLICAAEHYDLPELLQACFHHAKQFLRIEVVSVVGA